MSLKNFGWKVVKNGTRGMSESSWFFKCVTYPLIVFIYLFLKIGTVLLINRLLTQISHYVFILKKLNAFVIGPDESNESFFSFRYKLIRTLYWWQIISSTPWLLITASVWDGGLQSLYTHFLSCRQRECQNLHFYDTITVLACPVGNQEACNITRGWPVSSYWRPLRLQYDHWSLCLHHIVY